jgi:shikimate kinase
VTRRALAAASSGARQHVIDTTGSVVYLPAELRAALREGTRVIYLRSPERARAAMLERYRLEPKPVVWSGAFEPRAGEPAADALPRCFSELLRRRDALYAAMAHVVLDGAALEATDPGIDGWLAACEL